MMPSLPTPLDDERNRHMVVLGVMGDRRVDNQRWRELRRAAELATAVPQ